MTIKEHVLNFVEQKGGAKYTEIIEFIVDLKYGKGTYKSGDKQDEVWRYTNKRDEEGRVIIKKYKANCWRGYFSGAFSSHNPYFLKGKNRLVKATDHYIVVREK